MRGLKLGDASLPVIIAHLINTALAFLGVVMVLMILAAGFRWMFSGGDEEKVKKARMSLWNAIIGAMIIFLANSIVSFLISSLVAAGS